MIKGNFWSPGQPIGAIDHDVPKHGLGAKRAKAAKLLEPRASADHEAGPTGPPTTATTPRQYCNRVARLTTFVPHKSDISGTTTPRSTRRQGDHDGGAATVMGRDSAAAAAPPGAGSAERSG